MNLDPALGDHITIDWTGQVDLDSGASAVEHHMIPQDMESTRRVPNQTRHSYARSRLTDPRPATRLPQALGKVG